MKTQLKIYLSVFFVCMISMISAQENLLYQKIQEAKSKDEFKFVSSAFVQSKVEKKILEHFIHPEEVTFLRYDHSSTKNLSNAATLIIPLKNKELQLELVEVPPSFYDYKVVTDDGQRYPANKSIRHFRGVVKNDPGSIVAITFCDDEVMGLVVTDEGNFNLLLDRKSGQHLFYNDRNLKEKPSFECGTIDESFTSYDPEVLFHESKSSASSVTKFVRFYFETEHDIFQTRGSVASVENFVAGVYNQVATLYQNENIETLISEIFVWTTQDPYTSNNIETSLGQFQAHRTSFNGDLGQLLTFRPFEIGRGLAAGFNGLCNPNTAQRLSIARLDNNFSVVPNYSLSVFVVTHEFGHLFGSRHTHACVWNGNNTAIDGCGFCLESPNPADVTCNNCTRPPIPSGGGTIMSYCDNVNFNLGFGPQPGNVIRNNVNNANCLLLISGPSIVCNQATYTIENFPDGATITWSSDPRLSIISGQGTDLCTFSANGNGSSWVSAVIHINGSQITTPQVSVWVGSPSTTIEGSPSMKKGGKKTYTLRNIDTQGINSFSWNTSGGLFPVGSTTSPTLVVQGSGCGFGDVSCTYGNGCGYRTTSMDVEVICVKPPLSFILTPNPVTDVVIVELQEEQAANDELSTKQSAASFHRGSYEIELWSTSVILKRFTTDQQVYQIPVSGLPVGIYFVRVIKDGETITKKLIKR